MRMNTRNTTASNIQKAINNNLITVKSAKIESKDDYKTTTITAEQFKDDLEFYVESGIFSDSLDFKYTLYDTELTLYIGNMSNYCDKCITVEMIVNDGVSKSGLENVIKKIDL